MKRAQDEFVDEIPWVQRMIRNEFVDGAEWGRGRNTMGLVDDTG
ncbi:MULTISPECIES: hypothetical protein [Prevotella]|nr:hypothetical protein [Prevotella sp. C561]